VEELLVDGWGVPLSGEEVQTLLEASADATDSERISARRLSQLLRDALPAAADASAGASADAPSRSRESSLAVAAAQAADDGGADDGSGAGEEETAAAAAAATMGGRASRRWDRVVFLDPADVALGCKTDDLVQRHPSMQSAALPPWVSGSDRTGELGAARWLCLPMRDCAGWRQWLDAVDRVLLAAGTGSGIPGLRVAWVLAALGIDAARSETDAFVKQASVADEALRVTIMRLAGSDNAGPSGLHAAALSRVCAALRRAGGRAGGTVRRSALTAVLQEPPLCLDVDEADALASGSFAASVGAGLTSAHTPAAAAPSRSTAGGGEGESKLPEGESDSDEDGKQQDRAPADEEEAEQEEEDMGLPSEAEWAMISCDAWLASVRLAASGQYVPGSESGAVQRGLASLCGPACRLPLRAPIASRPDSRARRGRGQGFTGDAGPAMLVSALQQAGMPSPTGLPLTSRCGAALRWAAASALPLSADPGATVAQAHIVGAQRAGESLGKLVGHGLDGEGSRSRGVGGDGFGVGVRLADTLPQPHAEAIAGATVTARPYQTHKGLFFGRPAHLRAPVRGIGPISAPWGAAGGATALSGVHRATGGLLQCTIEVVAARGVPVAVGPDGRARVAARAIRIALVDLAPVASPDSPARPRLLAAAATLPVAWSPAVEDEWHLGASRLRSDRAARAAAGPMLHSSASAALAAARALPPWSAGLPLAAAVTANVHAAVLTDDFVTPAMAAATRAASSSSSSSGSTATTQAVATATAPMAGWNTIAIRAAHPRQNLTGLGSSSAAGAGSAGGGLGAGTGAGVASASAAGDGPFLLIELIQSVVLPAASADGEDVDLMEEAATHADGLCSESVQQQLQQQQVGGGSSAPGSSRERHTAAGGNGTVVEVCAGWATVPLSALAGVKSVSSERIRLTGGSLEFPMAIEQEDSLQRRGNIVGKAGNVIVGHRPATVEIKITPTSKLKDKDQQALALLPLGGEGGAGALLLPASAMRSAAAGRAASGAAVLVGSSTGLPYAPAEAVAALGAIPGGSVVQNESAAAHASSSGALDPALLTEDDCAESGIAVAHLGAAAALRTSVAGGADSALRNRDAMVAVMRLNARSKPNSVMAGVAAAGLATEFGNSAYWPTSRPLATAPDEPAYADNGQGTASVSLTGLLAASVPVRGTVPSAGQLMDSLHLQGLRHANPVAEEGSAQEPFDIASMVVGAVEW
jgi:hypothetical protein